MPGIERKPNEGSLAVKIPSQQPDMVAIPGGKFERGDHHGFIDPGHGSDEIPVRTLTISSFFIAKYDVTVQQYCDFLNSMASQKLITVKSGTYYTTGGPNQIVNATNGLVFLTDGKDILYLTLEGYKYSVISWDGSKFSVLNKWHKHPVTAVTWYGTAAYCNWLSQKEGYQPCYDTLNWGCYYGRNGYRLPTEAEWEYAARGGQYNPYYNYPWGDDADPTKANWPRSGDPWERGPVPNTTPVGFYNGRLQKASEYDWPASMETYQTSNGTNPWGLYDMAGNVWQWVNDWYQNPYYATCPEVDPPGPEMSEASPMPDGRLFRCLKGGNWYNGEADMKTPNVDNGHSRVSNRDPAYYLGHEEFHYAQCGFRVARRDSSVDSLQGEKPYGVEHPQAPPKPVTQRR